MVIVQTVNIDTRQGRNFIKDIIFYENKTTDVLYDITDHTFKAEVRAAQESTSTLFATIAIEIFFVESRIRLTMIPAVTLEIPIGEAFWDLLVTVDGVSQSWFEGTNTSTGGATEV